MRNLGNILVFTCHPGGIPIRWIGMTKNLTNTKEDSLQDLC